jgi:hypothetical protein
MRYELSDNEWNAINPMLPNKPRGMPRVDDRRVFGCCAQAHLARSARDLWTPHDLLQPLRSLAAGAERASRIVVTRT